MSSQFDMTTHKAAAIKSSAMTLIEMLDKNLELATEGLNHALSEGPIVPSMSGTMDNFLAGGDVSRQDGLGATMMVLDKAPVKVVFPFSVSIARPLAGVFGFLAARNIEMCRSNILLKVAIVVNASLIRVLKENNWNEDKSSGEGRFIQIRFDAWWLLIVALVALFLLEVEGGNIQIDSEEELDFFGADMNNLRGRALIESLPTALIHSVAKVDPELLVGVALTEYPDKRARTYPDLEPLIPIGKAN